MRCPFCGDEDTQVKDSRPSEDKSSVRRRRFCDKCDSRFTTIERIQIRDLLVIKKNGEKKTFDRDKITRAISTALRKRLISPEKIENIVNNLVSHLEGLNETEIPTNIIGEAIMQELSKIDQVAYVRFASVYKDFNTTTDFEEFIHKQLGSDGK